MQETHHEEKNPPESEIRLNPNPSDPDYFGKVSDNAAKDREEGESNPNFTQVN